MPHDQPAIPVEVADGHRFELIHVAAAEPDHTMLFLPGMGLSARLFIRFAQAMADRGTSVFIHEWRGNGSSSLRASRRENWGYRELLEDIGAARRTVAERARQDYVLAGHSLGSQFACLSAAADAANCRGLVIVAGGAPYWRVFPWPMKAVIMAIMFAFPALGWAFGYYPGKRVGFAGNEARGVMADWARSARSGRYEPTGVDLDLEAELGALERPALALDMADDWFVPQGSLAWLAGKLTRCSLTECTIDAESDDAKADHYAWMKRPEKSAGAIQDWISGAGEES